MSLYYYIVASLPMLTDAQQPPPLDSEGFMELCRRFIPKEDSVSLENSTLDPDGPWAPGICESFRLWEGGLRNSLAKLRAEEQGLDALEHLRELPWVFGTDDIASTAMARSTPLEAEIYLDSQRWHKIDELAWGHFFDIEFLCAYRLKLQILERQACFEVEAGLAAYRDIYGRVLDAAWRENA